MCVNKMMSNDGSCIDKINIYKHMSRAKVFLKGYARFYSSKQGLLGANDENTIKIWNLLKGSRQKLDLVPREPNLTMLLCSVVKFKRKKMSLKLEKTKCQGGKIHIYQSSFLSEPTCFFHLCVHTVHPCMFKHRSHLTTHLTSENRLILEYLGQCKGRAPASLDMIWFLFFFSSACVVCVPGRNLSLLKSPVPELEQSNWEGSCSHKQ